MNGTSGVDGTSGTSGSSGTSGTSGTSGLTILYRGTSTDSIDLSTLVIGNDKTLTTSTGLAYSIAQHLIVAYSNAEHFHGDVVSYTSSTGSLTIKVTDISTNVGTFASWTTNLDGAAGGDGTSGTSGTSGLLSLTGNTNNGLITLDGNIPNATVENNFTFDGNNLGLTGSMKMSGTFSGLNNNYVSSDSITQTVLLFLSNNC